MEVKKDKMKHSEIQIPSSALDFYVRLYSRKRRENASKLNNLVSEATKSWLTLSKSEKHHFITKYQLMKKNIQKQFANQLKNAVPYLKKKVLPRAIIETQTIQNDAAGDGDTTLDMIQTPAEDHEIPNIDGAYSDCDQNNSNQVIETPLQDQSNGNLYENFNIPISEPIPPKLLTGEQLFNMVKGTNTDLLWTALSTIEKRKYQNAVLSIKRNYLKEYKKYLEQLPSEKLYEHYKNNISSV